MELQDTYFQKEDYIETASGNKVCRQTLLCGSQNIILQGKVIVQADAIIRGDLAGVKTGRFCIISSGAVIRPAYKKYSRGIAFFPTLIGDHVFIGEKAVVNATIIGSYSYIGKNCVIGRRATLKDCCVILENTVIAPETVVPPFAIFAGSPGVQIGKLAECHADLQADYTRSYYLHFKPI